MEDIKFKCPICGNTELCWHETKTLKTPLAFENKKFEGADKVVEINITEEMSPIRCGNGHTLRTLDDEKVFTADDMVSYLKERKQIKEIKMSEEKTFNIMLSDLKEEAQKEFLEFDSIETSVEGNFDVFPIAVIGRSDEPEVE